MSKPFIYWLGMVVAGYSIIHYCQNSVGDDGPGVVKFNVEGEHVRLTTGSQEVREVSWMASSHSANSKTRAPFPQGHLQARKPLAKEVFPQRPKFEHRLVVKFHDQVRARAVDGALRLVDGKGELFHDELGVELRNQGVRFEQLLQLPEETLEFLETRGAAISGFAQPDLAGMILVDAPEFLIDQLALMLFEWDQVEWVDYMTLNPPPPRYDGTCFDIPPTTPNYTNQQGYRGPNPGLNMNALWASGFARGAGIRVADCEYGFNPAHEDLCGIIPEPNQTPTQQVYTNNWHQHGTAVFGEMLGGANDYGVTGLVPDAQGYFFPEWTVEGGSRRATCIANAIATMNPGDVVLLEMQDTFPGTSGYGPAEVSLPVWTVVRNGVDGGVVVVGAAGNGNQNLDAPEFLAYRNRGDSGSIIVGAGTPTVAHNKLSFSTYGSRVNVQGWGQSVFTTGYGSFSQIGNDVNQSYTSTFSGTSSASPFIAAACVALQSYSVANIGRRLTPLELRHVLINTGHPQGTGGHIGRFPNLIEAAALSVSLWEPLQVPPTSYSVTTGANIQGGLTDLAQSDDLRLCIDGVVTERQSIRKTVQIVVESSLPTGNVSKLGVKFEGHCDVPGIIQRIELYNYQNRNFQLVDTRNAGVTNDQVTWIELPGSLTHFFNSESRQRNVKARLTFTEEPGITVPSWTACIDQLIWFYVE